MARELKLADVMNDQIDAQAFVAPIEEPRKEKREFRTVTGEYMGHFAKTYLKIVDGGPNVGRKFMSILIKLYVDKKFRGSCFTKVSWKLVAKADGSPDLQFKLFQQLVQVLGAPAGADISDVLEAVAGEQVTVWGKEYYNVKVADLLPIHAKFIGDRGPESSVYIFVEPGEDAVAESYLAKGYKSEFMVMRISDLAKN